MEFDKKHENLEKEAVKKAFPKQFGKFKKQEAAEQKEVKKLSGKAPKK